MMRKERPVSRVGLSIRRAVQQQPGIHFRGLARAAQVTSAGQLRHHLDRLERQGILIEVEDGRYKRFFVAGQQDPRLRNEMARFSRAVPRRIAKLLLSGPMNRTELRRQLGCADSTLGYHLARMVQLGDLARARGPSSCLYSLTNGETVRKMLMIQGALAEPDPLADATPSAARPDAWPQPEPDFVPERSPPPPLDGNGPTPFQPEPIPEPEPVPDQPVPDPTSPAYLDGADGPQPGDDAGLGHLA